MPSSSDSSNAEILKEFVAESRETLERVEPLVVKLERGRPPAGEVLAVIFRCFHSFKGTASFVELTHTVSLAHAAESLLDSYRCGAVVEASHVDLICQTLDTFRGILDAVEAEHSDAKCASECARLTDALNAVAVSLRCAAALPATERHRQVAPSYSEVPSVDSYRGEPASSIPARAPASSATEPRSERTVAKGGGSNIRVDTRKLDELMNLVGELIIAETTVTKNPDLEGHEFENFQRAALNLNRLTRALQDIAMAVRMTPIAPTFRKMVRLVRDLSTKQQKRVELASSGEDTELDKTVIEAIGDPLVHLIRNSVDHGIESADERVARNKDPVGHVWLDAQHQGGEVRITIRDDGRGLDPKKLLRKAIECGIADRARRYSDRETFEFIFEPGFSTASQLTDISGRGVGMDVVRRNLEAVNGRVDVTSELGKGTTFVLRIPLTLAIIEGMVVRVGRAYYTIPLLAIRESVRATASEVTCLADGTQLLKLRQRHCPIIKLGLRHRVEGAVCSALDGTLVVVECGERLACILVDEVVGQRQTVVKPLPEYLKQVRDVAGCSIMHSGEISLILDVQEVVGAESHAARVSPIPGPESAAAAASRVSSDRVAP